MRGNVGGVREDIWIYRFITIAVFILLGLIYLFNATNGTEQDIPTDLLAGIIGSIMLFYFKREAKEDDKNGKNE